MGDKCLTCGADPREGCGDSDCPYTQGPTTDDDVEEELAQALAKEFHEKRTWEWNEVAEFVLQRFPGLVPPSPPAGEK